MSKLISKELKEVFDRDQYEDFTRQPGVQYTFEEIADFIENYI